MNALIYLWVAPHARHLVLLVQDGVWTTSGGTLLSPSAISQISLTLDLPSGRTSQECLIPKITPSAACSPALPDSMTPLKLSKENGLVTVWSSVDEGEWRGSLSTLNTSAYHNGADASLSLPSIPNLSQILQTSAHPRFYLSAKACAGILRRAEKRGKVLPTQLHQALQAVAGA